MCWLKMGGKSRRKHRLLKSGVGEAHYKPQREVGRAEFTDVADKEGVYFRAALDREAALRGTVQEPDVVRWTASLVIIKSCLVFFVLVFFDFFQRTM